MKPKRKSTKAKQPWLRRAFSIDAEAYEAAQRNIALGKFILEFLRNLIVVALLYAFARQTGNWLLYGLWALGTGALYGQLASLWEPIRFNYEIIKRRWLRLLINVLVFLLFAVLVFGSSIGMHAAVRAIAEARVVP